MSPSLVGWELGLRRQDPPGPPLTSSAPPGARFTTSSCPARQRAAPGGLSRVGASPDPTGCQAGTKSKQGAEGRSEAGQVATSHTSQPEGGGRRPCPHSPQACPSQGHSTSPSSMLKLLLRLLALEASGDMVEKRGSEASGSRELSRSMRSRSFLDRLGNREPCSCPIGSG